MTAATTAEAAGQGRRTLVLLHAAEDSLAAVALAVMVVLPLAEIAIRKVLAGGIPGAIPVVQHLTLWVGFVGAMLAARAAAESGTELPAPTSPCTLATI